MLERFLIFFVVTGSLVISERSLALGFPSDSIGIKTSGNHIYILHQVEKDENLFRLSLRYQVGIQDIVRVNPGSEKMIRIGQKLIIPYQKNNLINSGADSGGNRAGSCFQTASVNMQSTDSVYLMNIMPRQDEKGHDEISSDIDRDQQINEKKQKILNDPIFESTNGRNLRHVVTWGETVYSIAKRYHVTKEDICGWNGLIENRIYSGQELIIWPVENLEVEGSVNTESKNGIPNIKNTAGDRQELNEYDHLNRLKSVTSTKNNDKADKLKQNLSSGNTERLDRIQFRPLPIEYQLAIIFVATRGYLDSVPMNHMNDFEKEYIEYMKSQHSEVLFKLRDGVLDERATLIMRDVALDLAENYQ